MAVRKPLCLTATDRRNLPLALTDEGGELVVCPTYTAMLELQRVVAGRGLARPYWEEAAA